MANQVYHSTYSAALAEVVKTVESSGFAINEDDWFNHVNINSRKPNEGSTTRLSIPLYKADKLSKKQVHVQVYNRGYNIANNYELNFYISW